MSDAVVTKAGVRQKIWDYLEANNLANFPRPVHHRIPNFKGANAAGEKVIMMDVFKKARTVKVNPDKPQEWIRYKTLEERKTLLVPTPRLRHGLFNRIVPPEKSNTVMLKRFATREGITNFSVPIGLDHKVTIDLIVIGSVAITKSGLRIGKGEGYADMEYAMMATMGAVNENTVVVTTVHDCQVIDDVPDTIFGDHDLSVDYIVTPSQVIRCENRRSRPAGILWSIITPEKLQEIPVLKILRDKERRMGKNVSLKGDCSTEMVSECEMARSGNVEADDSSVLKTVMKDEKGHTRSTSQTLEINRVNTEDKELEDTEHLGKRTSECTSGSSARKTASGPSVYVGHIPRSLRVREFKVLIRDRNIHPSRVVWNGKQGHAFLDFQTMDQAKEAINLINHLEVNSFQLVADLSKRAQKKS